jgi:thiol-disulfide isomerase/thioredoxin
MRYRVFFAISAGLCYNFQNNQGGCKHMKKQNIAIALLMVVVMVFSACGGSGSEGGQSDGTGEAVLSSFSSTDISGMPVDQTIFSDYTLTMVNIWATFCSPCIKEMPDLALLHSDYAASGFQVVGIVADAKEGQEAALETVLSIVEQTGADYLHVLSSDSLAEAKLNSVQYVPETIFVDAQGNQIGESYVGSKDYDDWSEIIESLLEEVQK